MATDEEDEEEEDEDEEEEEDEDDEEEEEGPERTQDASAMLIYTLPSHVPSS